MNPIMRFVGRPDEKDPTRPNLFLGVSFKASRFLKPNTVYELQEIMGEVVLKEVGPSGPGQNTKMWNSDVSVLLDTHGRYLFLTVDEYQCECEKPMNSS